MAHICLLAMLCILTVPVQSTICWGPEINDHKPNDKNNRTDTEVHINMPHQPDTKIPSFCQGKTLAVQCKDENGETFTGPKNAKTSHYMVLYCDNVRGLFCEPYPDWVANKYTCPNLSLQVGCDCPTTHGSGTLRTTSASRYTPSGTAPPGPPVTTANVNPRSTTSAGVPCGGGNDVSHVLILLVILKYVA